MRTRTLFPFVAGCLGALWSSSSQAQSLSDCGNIHVEAEAQCELKGGVSCEAECTPINVQAACAGQLTAQCEGKCDLPNIDCDTLECEADCSADCKVDPGKFDCTANCQAECEGSCDGHCAAADNKAECEASCEANCGVSCQGHCDVDFPEADCDAKCNASCTGSCEADLTLDCQLDCQADLYGKCEADVSGGCKADCDTEEGALFCDGHYVDHGDHLEKCVSAIQAYIDAHVDGYAEGSASCSGGNCRLQGSAGATSTCAAAPFSPAASGIAGLAALSLSGLALALRKRSRR